MWSWCFKGKIINMRSSERSIRIDQDVSGCLACMKRLSLPLAEVTLMLLSRWRPRGLFESTNKQENRIDSHLVSILLFTLRKGVRRSGARVTRGLQDLHTFQTGSKPYQLQLPMHDAKLLNCLSCAWATKEAKFLQHILNNTLSCQPRSQACTLYIRTRRRQFGDHAVTITNERAMIEGTWQFRYCRPCCSPRPSTYFVQYASGSSTSCWVFKKFAGNGWLVWGYTTPFCSMSSYQTVCHAIQGGCVSGLLL